MALKTIRETTPWSDANKNPTTWPVGYRDRTVGTYFVITAVGSVLWGIRCYWPVAGVTVRAHVYEPNNDVPIVTKEFAIATADWHDLEFDAVDQLAFDGAVYTMQDAAAAVAVGWYCVTLYETTGTHVPRGQSAIPFPTPTYQACYLSTRDSYISAIGTGDVKPKTTSDRCFVDPIIYGSQDLFLESPVVQNQNPVPLSSGNRGDGSIYAEVVDGDGNLTASSVRFWANGVLAWSGASAATGWTGTRTPMVNGYEYDFTPDIPLPVGTITMRVYAVDGDGNVLDETWTFDTASFLDSVDVTLIPTSGGTRMIASGLFSLNPTEVYLGPLGTVADPPCYGGSGLGYAPMSLDGVTLVFWTPPLAKAAVSLTVVDGAVLNLAGIDVVERNWPERMWLARKQHAPWEGVGPRNLDGEELG